MLQQQESPDLLLGAVVRIAEDLKRSGSGITQSAFPHWTDPSLNLSGPQSGSGTLVHRFESDESRMCLCGEEDCEMAYDTADAELQ